MGSSYISEEASQIWIDEYYNTYYYPVLPKLNKIGDFDIQQGADNWEYDLGLQGGHIPFGSPGRKWDEEDLYAPISLTKLPSEWINYCLIDLSFDVIEDNILSDIGPVNNYGMLTDDYGFDYSRPRVSFKNKKPTIRTKISKKDSGKAY
jgi:hypothetical protein